MRTAELINYHEGTNGEASVPETAATPANDQGSAIVRQPDASAIQVTPGAALLRSLLAGSDAMLALRCLH